MDRNKNGGLNHIPKIIIAQNYADILFHVLASSNYLRPSVHLREPVNMSDKDPRNEVTSQHEKLLCKFPSRLHQDIVLCMAKHVCLFTGAK